jgi:eukaryotic-like serine/threonine-protein kinase
MPIPRSVDALVLACLEKDPARRPPDALTLLQRLDECDGARDWSNAKAAAWWQANLPALEAQPAAVAEVVTQH